MQKYRIALMLLGDTYYTSTQDDSIIYHNPENSEMFVKWLTDWITYDVTPSLD